MANVAKEYELLRDEMMAAMSYTRTIDSVLYTVTTLILTFALSSENKSYLVCLVPLFLILPAYMRYAAYSRSIVRLGAYLYVFLEGGDFNWERRHHKFDIAHCTRPDRKGPMRFYMLVLLCVASAFYKCLEANDLYGCIEKPMILIASLLFSIYIIYNNQPNYPELREEDISRWEEIKKAETGIEASDEGLR